MFSIIEALLPGDIQTVVDNVGDLRPLFHRLCFHLIQSATALLTLEGELNKTSFDESKKVDKNVNMRMIFDMKNLD